MRLLRAWRVLKIELFLLKSFLSSYGVCSARWDLEARSMIEHLLQQVPEPDSLMVSHLSASLLL